MTISQLNVSRLKEYTGATLSECENALIMANNDFEYALEILSENGKIKPSAAAKKNIAEGKARGRRGKD